MGPKDALLNDETRDLLETLARDLQAVSGSGPEGVTLFTLEAVEDNERGIGHVAAMILWGFLRTAADIQRAVLRGGLSDLE